MKRVWNLMFGYKSLAVQLTVSSIYSCIVTYNYVTLQEKYEEEKLKRNDTYHDYVIELSNRKYFQDLSDSLSRQEIFSNDTLSVKDTLLQDTLK